MTRDTDDPSGTAPTVSSVSLGNTQPAANNLSLSFSNGVASSNLTTTDVGKYAINLRDDTTASLTSAITGTLSNGSLSALNYSGGSATPNTLNYSEVGSFTLLASISNYLNTAGVNLSGLVFNAAGAQNAVVGRFTPYDFGVSLNMPNFVPGCASNTAFTYIGQSFAYGTQRHRQ